MHITQPLGAKLLAVSLPDDSQVNAKICLDGYGSRAIMLTSSSGRPFVEVSVRDLDFICKWASGA